MMILNSIQQVLVRKHQQVLVLILLLLFLKLKQCPLSLQHQLELRWQNI